MHDRSDRTTTRIAPHDSRDELEELTAIARGDPRLAQQLRDMQEDAYRQLQRIIDDHFSSLRARGQGPRAAAQAAQVSASLDILIGQARCRERRAEQDRQLAANAVIAILKNLETGFLMRLLLLQI